MNDEHGASKANGRYIAAAVDFFHHPVFKGAPFDPRSAWMWLIANAAWKDHRIDHKGKPVTLRRGQLLIGRAHLAAEWGWSEQNVRTFLARLIANGMLEIANQSPMCTTSKPNQKTGHYANVATICNYDKYQSRQPEAQPEPQPEANQSPPENSPHSNKDTSNKQKDQRTLSCTEYDAARASEPKFSDDKISGDGWVIDLKAVDMAAALACMPTDRARQIAQIIALDWSANKTRPQNPMAMVRAALMRDQRSGETHTATVGRKSAQDDHAKRVWAALDKVMPVGGNA